MTINQYEVWIADLNPQMDTETGKKRPVLVVQTNMLNNLNHPSTEVCPITTNLSDDVEILRVKLSRGVANLKYDCEIMIDQIRALDNRRLVNKIGKITESI